MRQTVIPPAPLQLRARPTGISFDLISGTPEQLTSWLVDQGFTRTPGRGEAEHARCRNGRQIVIVYHASALCQGSDTLDAAMLLLALCDAPPDEGGAAQLDLFAGEVAR